MNACGSRESVELPALVQDELPRHKVHLRHPFDTAMGTVLMGVALTAVLVILLHLLSG